ncbi:tafazzin protein [Danaus plexippus plexippus]|uniref:Tafazzin family protein n=1 Tax=Danaus plexippus plexippus TaxID=278856 RepID=A0A212F2F6_DANPL|nr:tafazzin homolog [Danaus plexippus plexippus]OWR47901.1 tafazzin protein [Danaus plexippus plexippus]
MAYDIGWIIPRLRNPGVLWNCASSITVAVVGLFSKIIVDFLNKTTVYNREALQRAVRRPRDVPLLTVSNHHSCFDDPGLWGVLDVGTLTRYSRMRWSLAAHDICFTNALHSAFFALGKCVPVVRGAGVYQTAMDFCVDRLCGGEWVHIFPEGRVNVDKQRIRFKWGVGRLVMDSAAAGRAPLVLPVWHEGMDRVLPNVEPYRLRFRNHLYLAVGEPLPLSPLLDKLRSANASEEETRRVITERIQEELMKLRDHTHALIRRTCPPGADRLLEPPVPDPGSSAAPRAPAAPLHNGKEHTHGEAPARRPALTKEKEL